jgi:DNA-binding transcriptional LysR family regulator
MPARHLPDGISSARVLDEPVQLLTGPGHQLAAARTVRPAQLAGHRIWMPGLVPGTEWAAFYDKLAAAFGLTIDVTSPDFGTEPLLDTIAASASLATLVGEQSRITWPAEWDLRRISVHDPVPVYPHALIWRADNPHPALTALRDYLSRRCPRVQAPGRQPGSQWPGACPRRSLGTGRPKLGHPMSSWRYRTWPDASR